MEISFTSNDGSVFPNTTTPGHSNVPLSEIECTINVGGGLCKSTRCLSTWVWVSFTMTKGSSLCFLVRLRGFVVLLPLSFEEVSWILYDTFLMGMCDFMTLFLTINESGKLFATFCKFIIPWTWSSDSLVRGSSFWVSMASPFSVTLEFSP
jgi:hypothetical protein